jgi:threonine dehydratase
MEKGLIMKITVQDIEQAAKKIEDSVKKTPLQFSQRLSDKYMAKIYLKREDLQDVRSFKIRGALNKITTLTDAEKKAGVVTASAGNHAQGVAFACDKLKIKGTIFMPRPTPNQKVERVKYFGNDQVTIMLEGDTYDESGLLAKEFSKKTGAVYIPAFDDKDVIAGQGTVGKEILEQNGKIDYILAGVGGGGLVAGIASFIKAKSPNTKIIGVESEGAAGMALSLKKGQITCLDFVDTFCDGIAVKTVGKLTFSIFQDLVDNIIVIPEGKVAKTLIELFQNDGIIAEPAGVLPVAALDDIAGKIKGKTIVCVISGGNNDLLRYPEVLEKSLVYQGKKYYFLIDFAQKPGQLKNFVNHVLGPTDDIALFEYVKKNNKEKGPALVGIELKDKKDLERILSQMQKFGFNYKMIEDKELLYSYLV